MNETCSNCGAEYHRIEDHCCHCTSLAQQLAAMTEKRNEWRSLATSHLSALQEATARIATSQAREAKLREALRLFGSHSPLCDCMYILTCNPPKRQACSCGLEAALSIPLDDADRLEHNSNPDLQSAWEKFKPTATDNFTSFVAGWLAHSHFGPARIGDEVRKKSGSEWEGKVVGYYSTELTPVGVCVESNKHRGSVQIYPITALEFATQHNPHEADDTPRTPR